MRHNLPSIKTLATIAGDNAKAVRAILESTKWSEIDPDAKIVNTSFTEAKLDKANELLQIGEVQYIHAGLNSKSPAIYYLNAGDPYKTTLMFVSGRGYKVGRWGDIVERGNYEDSDNSDIEFES